MCLGLKMNLRVLIQTPCTTSAPSISSQAILFVKRKSAYIHILLSFKKKIDIETDVVSVFNCESSKQLHDHQGPMDLPTGRRVQKSLADSLTPGDLNSLNSIKFGSPLSVAIITNASFLFFLGRYIYPLDSSTWIEYWPTDTACPSCQAFLANLDTFAEDIFLNGCESP